MRWTGRWSKGGWTRGASSCWAAVGGVKDLDARRAACGSCGETDDRPTLVIVRSHIAWGAPNAQDTAGAHGAPLGDDEVRLAKGTYGWPQDESFLVPEEVPAHFREGIGARGRELREAWDAKFEAYRQAYPDWAAQLDLMARRELPDGWDADIQPFEADAKGMATRASSGKVLNQVGKHVPWMLGGSADRKSGGAGKE